MQPRTIHRIPVWTYSQGIVPTRTVSSERSLQVVETVGQPRFWMHSRACWESALRAEVSIVQGKGWCWLQLDRAWSLHQTWNQGQTPQMCWCACRGRSWTTRRGSSLMSFSWTGEAGPFLQGCLKRRGSCLDNFKTQHNLVCCQSRIYRTLRHSFESRHWSSERACSTGFDWSTPYRKFSSNLLRSSSLSGCRWPNIAERMCGCQISSC